MPTTTTSRISGAASGGQTSRVSGAVTEGTSRRITGAASGGQTARVSGAASGGDTERVSTKPELYDFLLLEGDESGYLLLETALFGVQGKLILDGDAQSISSPFTKRVA